MQTILQLNTSLSGTGRKVYVFATRGGQYAGTAGDLQTAYLRQLAA